VYGGGVSSCADALAAMATYTLLIEHNAKEDGDE
jgi:hypothetical protein